MTSVTHSLSLVRSFPPPALSRALVAPLAFALPCHAHTKSEKPRGADPSALACAVVLRRA